MTLGQDFGLAREALRGDLVVRLRRDGGAVAIGMLEDAGFTPYRLHTPGARATGRWRR